jgi:DNA-binding transcriptional ArsR family regulator
MNPLLDAALKYRDMGFSVIPLIPKEKTPIIKEWKPYQKKSADKEQLESWWKQWPNANVGIVTGMISGICVVDLDKYKPDYSEEISLQYFPDNIQCPIVETPQGGNHLYFLWPGKVLSGKAKQGNLPAIDFRCDGNYIVAPPSVNGTGKPYAWVNEFCVASISALPSAYINIISTLYKGDVTHVTQNNNILSQESQVVTILLNEGTRNESLFHIAHSLIKGGMSRENALQVIESLGKSCCKPPMLPSEISSIIASAISRNMGRERNIHQEVESWIRVTSGDFTVTSCYSELQIVTKEQKAAARTAFNRLQKAELIEKAGERDGIYRIRDSGSDEINFITADTTPYDIRWPMGIHEYVSIYPRSIIIIAGVSNAGKTAYCLNVARKNRLKREINYFLTEADPAELKVRLEKFGDPLEAWHNVKFKRPRGNLSKAINPDGFNIIDYLEIHKDFYEVSGLINDIYEKLNTGIAIIAMQKPPGRDLGIGGRGTLDKARLYLSIDPGVIKIVKGKIWRNEAINPDGLFLRWRLGGGCHFKEEGTWSK